MQSFERIQRLSPNTRGEDYVVGDIHGHFGLLESALSRLGFDPERDRLLSVGDLIDRGPESPRAADFLIQPWFFAIRGNHEQMMLDAVGGERHDPGARALWYHNGGAWFEHIADAQAGALLAPIGRLPYALAVELADGRQIGLVHADVPFASWPATMAALVDADERDAVLDHAVWSRERAGALQARLDGHRARMEIGVTGVDRVFFGHTPMPAAVAHANTRWLDTGVFLPRGRLSIAAAGDDTLWSFAADDNEPDIVHDWRVVD
ncbi:metallophosphoesterase [Salinisphaera sp.]|uniref:metallophosphoesterase n=1 Tax=Salinisphaera sp. TaxID=1914330 RepID=UPI002D769C3C|nr:metallophosphoesterase [Salinisphaera sp.]HET7314485.1 metallophosphoesterase [Salinisphaera sp.]